MKRRMISMMLLAALALAGCSANTGGEASRPGEEARPEDAQNSEYEYDSDEMPAIAPPVADTALYRGEVETIEEEGDGLLLLLRQVEGTDFGFGALLVNVTESTRRSIDLDEIALGDYVEVYYGGVAAEGETAVAIILNRLPAAADSIFNGVLESVRMESDDSSTGYLDLVGDDGDAVVFAFSPETQFYLDFDALEEGERLNVYCTGMFTRSIPPQGVALEVRPQAAGADDEPAGEAGEQ